jgi:hypothetical protein
MPSFVYIEYTLCASTLTGKHRALLLEFARKRLRHIYLVNLRKTILGVKVDRFLIHRGAGSFPDGC